MYNLRAKCRNKVTGAIAIYTWYDVPCTTAQAHVMAEALAKTGLIPEQDLQILETSLVDQAVLEEESRERCREKAEAEWMCGGYDAID